jgi:hypothetical protein
MEANFAVFLAAENKPAGHKCSKPSAINVERATNISAQDIQRGLCDGAVPEGRYELKQAISAPEKAVFKKWTCWVYTDGPTPQFSRATWIDETNVSVQKGKSVVCVAVYRKPNDTSPAPVRPSPR